MHQPEQAILTNMCMIYDHQGNVLVEDRVKQDWPGITFPGGHVEKNEPIVDSTIREVKEETNLDVKDLRICGVMHYSEKGVRHVIFLLKTDQFSGDIKSSSEGKISWIKLKNIDNYKLTANMDKILKVFTDDKINEFYGYPDSDKFKLI